MLDYALLSALAAVIRPAASNGLHSSFTSPPRPVSYQFEGIETLA